MVGNNFTDKITICIPVFERYKYFEEAVSSALSQSIQCKIIVVDNASSHDQFANFCKQNNIDYFRNEANLGMEENWNKCIENAQTEWISILHDDDILYSDFIEKALELLATTDAPVAVAVDVEVGPEITRSVSAEKPTGNIFKITPKRFLATTLSPFPGVVFSKKIAEALGGFDTTKRMIADFDFWYRLSVTGNVYLLNSIHAFYRVSPGQISVNNVQKVINDSYRYRMAIAENKYERLTVKKNTRDLKIFYEKSYQIAFTLPFSDKPGTVQNIKNFIKKIWKAFQ